MLSRALLGLAVATSLSAACRAHGPIGDHPGDANTAPQPALVTPTTRVVMAKRAPDRLIARDGSQCRVTAEVFAATPAGSEFQCPWVASVAPPGA